MKHTSHFLVRTGAIVVMLVATLLVASCYWNPRGGIGKITLQIPQSAVRSIGAAQATQAGGGATETARVYLYNDNMNAQVPIGTGSQYVEATVGTSGGSITLDTVPPGDGYTLVLTLGSYSGTTFVPAQYGQSAPFQVSAGKSTDVSLSLNAVPFSATALVGTSINGLGYDPVLPALYASSSSSVYVDTTPTAPTFSIALPTPEPKGGTFNSLTVQSSSSATNVWANSSTGIYACTYPGQGSVQLTPIDSKEPTQNILRSGGFTISGTVPVNDVFYLTPQGLGGGVTGPSSWFPIDMSDGTTIQPTFDFDFSNTGSVDYGYFATGAGAFSIGAGLLGSTPTLTYIKSHAAFVKVNYGGRSLISTSLSLDSQANPTDLYLGTVDGIFSTPVAGLTGLVAAGTGGTVTVASPPLAGTAGHPYRRIAVNNGFGTPYYVGVSNNVLIGVKPDSTGTTVPFEVPLPAVTLGNFQAMTMFYTGTAIYLIIGGTKGVTVIDLSVGVVLG